VCTKNYSSFADDMLEHEGWLDCEATNYNEENEDIEGRRQPGHLIRQETPNLR
jgi:hypothetical protein